MPKTRTSGLLMPAALLGLAGIGALVLATGPPAEAVVAAVVAKVVFLYGMTDGL